MRGVRPSGADHGIDRPAERPVLPPSGGATDEVLIRELTGIESTPEASGTAKVRDAGLGTHSGAREGDRAAGAREQLRQPHSAVHGRRRCNQRTQPAKARPETVASPALSPKPSRVPHCAVSIVNRVLLMT